MYVSMPMHLSRVNSAGVTSGGLEEGLCRVLLHAVTREGGGGGEVHRRAHGLLLRVSVCVCV